MLRENVLRALTPEALHKELGRIAVMYDTVNAYSDLVRSLLREKGYDA